MISANPLESSHGSCLMFDDDESHEDSDQEESEYEEIKKEKNAYQQIKPKTTVKMTNYNHLILSESFSESNSSPPQE